MKNEDAVKIRQDLPQGLILPRTMIQIQKTVGGGGEQIDIMIDEILTMDLVKNGNLNKFQCVVVYKTASGKILTYDQRDTQWRYINPLLPIDDSSELVWVFPL